MQQLSFPTLSAHQIDIISNAIAGIQTLIGLGFLVGVFDSKEALIGVTLSTIAVSVLTGKGIPSVLEIASNIQQQTGTDISKFKPKA